MASMPTKINVPGTRIIQSLATILDFVHRTAKTITNNSRAKQEHCTGREDEKVAGALFPVLGGTRSASTSRLYLVTSPKSDGNSQ